MPPEIETSNDQTQAGIYRAALTRIAKWFGEFPDTGKTWDDGTPMSYSACWGSNGERDFMRQIAVVALEQGQFASPDETTANSKLVPCWCPYCSQPHGVDRHELPPSLRDPLQVMERGRELLPQWGPTPVTDAALDPDFLVCARHGQIVETGCPDCERALGRSSQKASGEGHNR